MPLTTPDNIFYADGSTPLSVEAISAAEATSIQEALTNSRAIRSFKWADQDAQDDQIDMQAGDEGYRIDTRANYRYNGTQWKRSEGGLVLMRPSAVSGAGVAVTTSGKVTFAGATTVDVDGCFTTEFDNYRLMLNIPTVSVANNFNLQLKTGGVANGSSLYDWERIVISGTSISSVANTSISWGPLGVGARLRHTLTGDFLGPMLPQYTVGDFTVSSGDAGVNVARMAWSTWYRAATLFDGLKILREGSGTITGTLAIYGYND